MYSEFCGSLIEHAMKIINFKRKKMKLSTKAHQGSYENATVCCICKDKFEKTWRDKKYCTVRNHCHYTGSYRGAAHSII